jgi:two-component system sensor histidine kinase HydH
MSVRRDDRTQRSFSPVYLAILSGIILIILIINGLLEINRTRRGFFLLLEQEANLLLQYFQKNIQETLEALETPEQISGERPSNLSLSEFLFNLEESVAEYLVESAHRIDEADRIKPLTLPELRSLVERYALSSIDIYDPSGILVRGWPETFPPATPRALLEDLVRKKRSVVIDFSGKAAGGEPSWFSVGITRMGSTGFIVLRLNVEQRKRLMRQIAIQRVISDVGLREGILSVSVLDDHLTVLAHSDATLLGRTEREEPFLRRALQSPLSLSRLYHPAGGPEVFEMVKSFALERKPAGLIRIAYSVREMVPILSHLRKNVALSVFFFLVFGILAVSLIGLNQNRHLKRVREMEDRIQLAERLSSLGHLAAGVAHEIRNPLNAIGLGLQRMRREFLPPDGSNREAFIGFTDVISKEVRRVNDIVEQFLTLARPLQLNMQRASLQELLSRLITLFQEEAASHHIEIQREIASDLPATPIDSDRLTQALINIIKNGMEAMEEGGTLRVQARVLKNQVEVVIADSGPGIPPDRLEKVFNYYYTTKETGTGLGLPLAHRIIEAHGGQLELESQAGSGTTVKITLPLEKKDSRVQGV